jgi:hypothetical protein
VGHTGIAENTSDTATGPVGATVPQTAAGSLVVGGSCKSGSSGAFSARDDNSLVEAAWDNSTEMRCSVWRLTALSPGGDVTIGAILPNSGNWVAAAGEILPQ